METDAFIDAITELAERTWITIILRKPAPGTPPDPDSRPLTDIARLCTTRFGRRRYRTTWPTL